MDSFFSERVGDDPGCPPHIALASSSGGATSTEAIFSDWQFFPDHTTNPSLVDSSSADFTDPFHDPLLDELMDATFIVPPDPAVSLLKTAAYDGNDKVHIESMRRPRNIFSDVQILIKPSPIATGSRLVANDYMAADQSGVQILSPRTPRIKRKSQAKKVVCIPAPAASSNKTGGEVVPSDHWSWRKYGQKPIKGSPYPRGYYKCSSSKGCSARKQVERSQADPNMLVVTYTSDHNHPRPTQRNALAGSTKSQTAKNNPSTIKNSPGKQVQPSNLNEELKEATNPVEEVVVEIKKKTISAGKGEGEGEGYEYKPMMLELNDSDAFFTDLGELEDHPMDLHFSTKGFLGDEERDIKASDPFGLFELI